ncbi:MAG: helix-turn-helix transcriptional regulator [Deltaproteobacteria bacterium]|nr:helix-turn-helix transcriptional regulator [Deltaproteobacteria bacterium]
MISGTYPVVMGEQPTPATPVLPPEPEQHPVLQEDASRPDPLAISVATEVARMRREAGLSERAAARKLGTSQTQLRRMEDPRYLPSLRSLARLAAAYGYTIELSFQPRDDGRRAAKPPLAPERPRDTRRTPPRAPAVRRGHPRAARRDRPSR